MKRKKQYIKPIIQQIELDSSISLQMQSGPHDPPPRGGTNNNKDSQPFQSPFGDKPFS